MWLKNKEIHCWFLHVTAFLSTEKSHVKVGGWAMPLAAHALLLLGHILLSVTPAQVQDDSAQVNAIGEPGCHC